MKFLIRALASPRAFRLCHHDEGESRMSAQQDDQRQNAREGQWPDAETDAGAGQAALALTPAAPRDR